MSNRVSTQKPHVTFDTAATAIEKALQETNLSVRFQKARDVIKDLHKEMESHPNKSYRKRDYTVLFRAHSIARNSTKDHTAQTKEQIAMQGITKKMQDFEGKAQKLLAKVRPSSQDFKELRRLQTLGFGIRARL